MSDLAVVNSLKFASGHEFILRPMQPPAPGHFRRPPPLRRGGPLLFALLLWATAGAPDAWAGAINAETLATAREEGGWIGLSSTSLGMRYGNIDKFDLSQTGVLQYQTMFSSQAEANPSSTSPFVRQRLLLATNLSFSRAASQRIVNSGYAHFRFSNMWLPRLGMEVYLQGQYNEFTFLKSRLLAGAGVRVNLVHRNVFRMWGGSGYMAEHEVNDVIPGDSHPARLFNHRWSTYLGLVLRLADERVGIQETVYVQPLWNRPSDVRVLSDFALTGKVTEVLTLGINFELNYDSRPPGTIERLDLSLRSVVTFRFG